MNSDPTFEAKRAEALAAARQAFDLKTARRAFDDTSRLEGGFFVIQPEAGPTVFSGAIERPQTEHAELFRAQLKEAIRPGDHGAATQSFTAKAGKLEASKPAIQPNNKATPMMIRSPLEATGEDAPQKKAVKKPAETGHRQGYAAAAAKKKRPMTVRRFLFGF